MPDKNILVAYWYYSVDEPMRAAISSHLHALDRSENQHRILYLNTHFDSIRDIDFWNFDAIIYHTTVLQPRWVEARSEQYPLWQDNINILSNVDCLKIAIPQDEYDHAHILDDWFEEWGVDAILTNFDETYREELYPKMSKIADFYTCYTGYINDEDNRLKGEGKTLPVKMRSLDIVYRASNLPYWFGSHGQLKHQIADVVVDACQKANLKCDISTDYSDVILGSQWYSFMASGKATIGAESGSSVLDSRGEIMKTILEITKDNPKITFEEIDKLLPKGWDDYKFFALSPRHFEAVIAKTCQILVEGHYDGVFKANKHYIPVKRDFSNLMEVLEKIKDDDYVQSIVDQAYEDIYLSGKYTYQRFAKLIESVITEQQEKNTYSRPDLSDNDNYILMLTPHEPFQDPRVKWVANMAKKLAPVSIHSSMMTLGNKPEFEIVDGIAIHRMTLTYQEKVKPIRRKLQSVVWYLLNPVYTFRKITWKLSKKTPKTLAAFLPSKLTTDPATDTNTEQDKTNEPGITESVESNFDESIEIGPLKDKSSILQYVMKFPARVRDSLLKVITNHIGIAFHSNTLYESASKNKRPPSLIICHDIFSLPAAVKLKELYNCPLIYDSHEFWPEVDLEGSRGLRAYFTRREKQLIQNADEIITVSPQIARAMEALYSKPVISIPNAEPFEPSDQISLNKPNGVLKFVFQGGIVAHRGIDELLELWKHINTKKATLTIRAPHNTHVDFLKVKYKDLVNSGSLIFADPVTEDELISAASESDIGIIPYIGPCINHLYACPNKLSQYMQAGLAVFYCSDLQFVAQKIEEYESGLSYDPYDPTGFIDKVNYLIDNPDEVLKMKQNAYSSVQNDFNWEIQSRGYLEAIKRQLGILEEESLVLLHDSLLKKQ